MIKTQYLQEVLEKDQIRPTIKWVAKQLKAFNKQTPFTSIAIRGMSGAIIGGAISALTNIPLTIVRKEDSHFSRANGKIEGETEGDYVIVDDITVYGDTITTILKTIHKDNEYRKCVGIILYSSSMHADTIRNLLETITSKHKFNMIDPKSCLIITRKLF